MQIEHFLLGENGWVPNNPRLPVLVYRAAFSGADLAAAAEARFRSNGWPPQWRYTMYDYHHYHSTAHEALAIVQGHATLMIGGPDATTMAVGAGDVLVLPAGTGHRRVSTDADFLMVGAYPAGQQWDMCCCSPSPEQRARIAELPVPASIRCLGAMVRSSNSGTTHSLRVAAIGLTPRTSASPCARKIALAFSLCSI